MLLFLLFAKEIHDLYTVPQSTPKKDSSRPGSYKESTECSGAVKLFISTPKHAAPRPRKQRSSSGFYFAFRPLRNLSQIEVFV